MKTITTLSLLISSFTFAQSIANYDIAVSTIWTTAQHTSVPGNAHWSPLIGATHNTADEFMSIGSLATTGVKNVAETGNGNAFSAEINAAITAGRADQLLVDGFAPFAGNNSNANFSSLEISEDFPLITLISMVAPSPDWFIAVNSLNLRSGNNAVNNGWKDTFTMDVFVYDSGTDDGTNYSSANSANTPVPIFMRTGFPTNGNAMATITFTYNSSTLSTSTFSIDKQVSLYPNPASDYVTLKNSSQKPIQSITIYNVLGKAVLQKQITTQDDSISIPTSQLNSGLYMVRIVSKSNAVLTKKLIIE